MIDNRSARVEDGLCQPAIRPARFARLHKAGASGFAIAAVLGVLSAASLAPMGNSANAQTSSPRMAQVQHACSVVLGFDPSEEPYITCVKSLNQSLSNAPPESVKASEATANIQAGALSSGQQAQLACADVGYNRGSGAFADCASDLRESLSDLKQLDR